jgi:2-oxoglutarate ferredoxin oxidoreductase subunit alpha
VLKQEALGLAVVAELPVVVIDIQRAGPSTGMPTKTEQADLLLALHGRNSESPIAILAAATPGDCFHTVLEAFQLAVRYMTPVVVMSDGYLANSAEPWRIPDVASLRRTPIELTDDPEGFQPYARDPATLARPWAIPGTPGLEHRIGGLSKADITGNVSYAPENNQRMHELRHEKIARIANEIPPLEVMGPERGDLLIVGWGGTYGAITSAAEDARRDGLAVSNVHLRYLNPFPSNLEQVLRCFDRVLIPELNRGQLAQIIRSRFLIDARPMPKEMGQPFRVEEIRTQINAMIEEA